MLTLKVQLDAENLDRLLLGLEEVQRLVASGYTSTLGYDNLSFSVDGEEEEEEDE